MPGIHRRDAKRDANEKQLAKDLRHCGVFVMKISGEDQPDLACYYRGQWFMLEVKTEKGRVRKNQNWDETIEPGAVPIVRTLDEALRAIGAVK